MRRDNPAATAPPTTGEDPLREQLAACTGPDFQQHRQAADPVCSYRIRRWTEAFGDANPAYLDPSAAGRAGRTAPFAPPAMLAAFTGPSLAEFRAGAGGQTPLGSALESLGFITPGTGIQQVYSRDILAGDVISETSWPESVSERKTTKLGAGYFITYRSEFVDQHGQLVGTQRLGTFAFQPGASPAVEETAARAEAPGSSPETPASEDVQSLPAREITLDRMDVIACCIAMGDFNPAHFDPALAAASGFPDIFTDIYSGPGFAQAYVSNWAGAAARITSVDAKLGVPLLPGDTLRLSGRVEREDATAISVQGYCSRGLHLAATVVLRGPTS